MQDVCKGWSKKVPFSGCLHELFPAEACDDDNLVLNSYRGTASCTISGKTCQKWSVNSPHSSNFDLTTYATYGLGDHNYCRNPDNGEPGIWCYTTDPDVRYDLCCPGNCTKTCSEPGNPSLDLDITRSRFVFVKFEAIKCIVSPPNLTKQHCCSRLIC